MRLALAALSALMMTACAPEVPDSGAGVGFDSYSDYMRRRDAELSGAMLDAPITGPVISTERIADTGPAGVTPATPPATAAPSGTLAADRPRGDTIAGVRQQSGEMVHSASPGISDEQNFDAVASRESIESDRERLRQQREQYVVIPPTALPQRSGSSGPNIVDFALSTSHAPGVPTYRRSGIRLTSYERACGRFTSADFAQEEFLASGGPERDPKGLDPDGDGFACGWDPRPFRAARQ